MPFSLGFGGMKPQKSIRLGDYSRVNGIQGRSRRIGFSKGYMGNSGCIVFICRNTLGNLNITCETKSTLLGYPHLVPPAGKIDYPDFRSLREGVYYRELGAWSGAKVQTVLRGDDPLGRHLCLPENTNGKGDKQNCKKKIRKSQFLLQNWIGSSFPGLRIPPSHFRDKGHFFVSSQYLRKLDPHLQNRLQTA